MGLYGKVSSLWTNPPGRDEKQFTPDPLVGSTGFQDRLQSGDEAYYNAMMKYAEREPGFDEETLSDIYKIPAEQSKFSEKEALRRVNQGAAAGGVYHGGKRKEARGEVLATYGAGRAGMQRQTRVDAAKVALEDRLNQLRALAGFVDPRMQASLAHTGQQNTFNMNLNSLALQEYLKRFEQYQEDLNWTISVAASAAAGGMGGGGMAGAMGGGLAAAGG